MARLCKAARAPQAFRVHTVTERTRGRLRARTFHQQWLAKHAASDRVLLTRRADGPERSSKKMSSSASILKLRVHYYLVLQQSWTLSLIENDGLCLR